MGLMQEFKEFALKGNVVDLAVGVIVGASFGRVISSLVDDLLMPPIGRLIGNVDFSNLYLSLSDKVAPGLPLPQARAAGPVLAYGNFITIVINFLIVTFCIFLVIKAMNRMMRKQSAPPPGPTLDQKLLTEIRDLLKQRT